MKLLYCGKCNDCFKLDYKFRKCNCHNTGGKYLSDGDQVAAIKADMVSVCGIMNRQLHGASIAQTHPGGENTSFDINFFVFPQNFYKIHWCKTKEEVINFKYPKKKV